MDFNKIKTLLEKKEIQITKGLTDAEFQRIEGQFQIQFPPDLHALLANFLPLNKGFVNWRDDNTDNIKIIEDSLQWPLEGMIFDIEQNNFWYEKWGEKPNSLKLAVEKCKEMFLKVPKLIPIYSHRYIPMIPMETGNPIFSVYQTDIIYYGENLEAYLQNEFGINQCGEISLDSVKKIPFWSDLAS